MRGRWTGLALIGCAAAAPAQTTATAQGQRDQRAIAQPGQQQPAAAPVAATPIVAAERTAARPLAVTPVPYGPARPAPVYRPDAGGWLSGLPDDAARPPATAPVATLTEAVTLAYRYNPQLLAARAQARGADFRVPQARAAYGPTLSGTAGYSYTRIRQEVVPGRFAGAQGWTSTASAILNQPLFTSGRNAAAEAGAYATVQYQRDVLRLTEAQVLQGVVTVYVQVLRDAAAVTIARENLALLQRQLGDNETRFRVRDLTLTDLEQTRTRVELGRAQLIQAEGQLGISQTQFLQFVGAAPGDLAPPDLLDIRFASLSAAYGFAESNSALIRAAQAREKISRAAVDAARAEAGPRVDLRGTADYGSVSPYTDRLRTSQLVGQVLLTQPLVDSNLRRARLGEAREANQADWRLLDQALRDTRQAIGAAWARLASARTSLGSYRAAIVAAQRAYDGALEQQRSGDRSTLDVLDLARDLLTVRNSYNSVLADEYLARATLLAAAGGLEAPLIVPGLVGYDPEWHFARVRGGSDIPLLTSALSALDGAPNREDRRDRPSRDAGAAVALDETVPLPPADPVTAPTPAPATP